MYVGDLSLSFSVLYSSDDCKAASPVTQLSSMLGLLPECGMNVFRVLFQNDPALLPKDHLTI